MVAVNPARFGPRAAEPLGSYMADARSIIEDLFDKTNKDDLPPIARAAIEANERVRGIAARKFGDIEGEELLEALCDSVLRRPVFLTQTGMPLDQVALLGSFLEGMAATVYLLLAWIAEGRSEQPPQREGGLNDKSRRSRNAGGTRRPARDADAKTLRRR